MVNTSALGCRISFVVALAFGDHHAFIHHLRLPALLVFNAIAKSADAPFDPLFSGYLIDHRLIHRNT